MRRGSVIAPLLLILIGGVFLVRNIRPEWPLFETLFTWWPVLLIGWGVLRVIEILVAHFAGRPLPARGLSGGEWALVVIITIMGAGVWSAQHFAQEGLGRIRIGGVEVFGESFEYPVEAKSLKAGKTPQVTVDIGRGSARVVGADTDEVKITARKSIRALNKRVADGADKDTPLTATATGETVVIRAGMNQPDNIRVTYDVEITVPKGASVTCQGQNVDLDLSEVDGRVLVDSERSGVRIQNVGGKVTIDTRSSDLIRAVNVRNDVELRGRGRDIELENVTGQVMVEGGYSGETIMRNIGSQVRFDSSVTELRAGKIPGTLNLTLSALTGNGITGPVLVKARSKDVRLADVTGQIQIELDRGDVDLVQSRPDVAKIDVKVRSGAIEVALPEAARFSLDAETERGEVMNDFGGQVKEESSGRGGKLTANTPGAPVVTLKTERGSLTVRKAVPAPPTPPAPPKTGTPAPPPRADNL
ncbi:MAG: DUF4097 family beta strand repeat protein [Bryobacteraceae bacterium]|nr:DUF4097 family beta strand repeat protein [Bryobacteraceae bacterium]